MTCEGFHGFQKSLTRKTRYVIVRHNKFAKEYHADLEELPDLRKDAYKPLYIQLSETLAEYIRGKRLQAGTTLPRTNPHGEI